MKTLCSLLFYFAFITQVSAQLNIVTFEQIADLQKVEKRPLIVFVHTDWCKYCGVMKSTTFKNIDVINTLNKKFYFVDFNAETKRHVQFNNTLYKYKSSSSTSGVHELAVELATVNKQINYPAICILNEHNEIVFQYSSFLNAKDFLQILNRIQN